MGGGYVDTQTNRKKDSQVDRKINKQINICAN